MNVWFTAYIFHKHYKLTWNTIDRFSPEGKVKYYSSTNYALRWNGLSKEFHPGVLWSLRKDGLWAGEMAYYCSLKPLHVFQSLTSIESWKDKSEQRRPVLPAPLAGLLSWPFSVKEGGGAGSKLKNTEKEFKLHVEIWIIAAVWVLSRLVWIEIFESVQA